MMALGFVHAVKVRCEAWTSQAGTGGLRIRQKVGDERLIAAALDRWFGENDIVTLDLLRQGLA
jgi:hypothetical protein